MLALRTSIETDGMWYYPFVAETNLDKALHDDEVDYSWYKIARIFTHEGRTLLIRTPAGSQYFALRDPEIAHA